MTLRYDPAVALVPVVAVVAVVAAVYVVAVIPVVHVVAVVPLVAVLAVVAAVHVVPCIRNPRPQCARQSKLCYPVNHLPFHRKQCISVVRKWLVVDLPRRKDATKVFIREVNSNKYVLKTVLSSSCTWFENTSLNLS